MGRKYPAIRISSAISTLARLGVVAYFGLFAAPAFAQLGLFLSSPSQFFGGDQIHPVACAGCTANKSFHTKKILQQQYPVSSVVWSPDGKYLSVGSLLESQVNIYDTSSWRLVSHINASAAGEGNSVIQFTSDSKYLIRPRFIMFNDKFHTENVSLQKWDIAANSIAGNFPSVFQSEKELPNDLEKRDSYARAVAASKMGNLVAAAVGGNGNGHILIYDSKEYSILRGITCDYRAVPEAMAFSPDNEDLAVGGCHRDNYVIVFNIHTDDVKFQTVVDQGSELYNFISYSPNGSLIAVASDYNGEYGTLTILKAVDGSLVGILPTDKAKAMIPLVPFPGEHATITNLQWIDNNLVFASYDGLHPDGSVARVWNVRSLTLAAEYAGDHMQIASLSPDGSRMAAAIGDDVIIGNLK